ncbi:hypothetical protein K523DRAFT_367004, partial [Schizophyllum commune Tattone D]
MDIPIDPVLLALQPDPARDPSQSHAIHADGPARLPAASHADASVSLLSTEAPEQAKGTRRAKRKLGDDNPYSEYDLPALKKLCAERGIEVGRLRAPGLTRKLIELDARVPAPSPRRSIPQPASSLARDNNRHPSLRAVDEDEEEEVPPLDPAHLEQQLDELQSSFQAGYARDEASDYTPESVGAEEVPDQADIVPTAEDSEVQQEHMQLILDRPGVSSASDWVDRFILEARRKGGIVTEQSVLRQWRLWALTAVATKAIPDLIVDANHIILYLQHTATRQLLSKRGTQLDGDDRLSSNSIKKHMTMLGRIRRRQVDDNPALDQSRPFKTSRVNDFYKALLANANRQRLRKEGFDVAKNTILDTELLPEHFEQVKRAALHMNQIPSVIKAHFCWTWQCATLNRSDELTSLLLQCLQPYNLSIPTYIYTGRYEARRSQKCFGVLALFHESKTYQSGVELTEPIYSYVL